VEKEAHKFPSFKVEYQAGAPPVLQMKDAAGKVESLTIDNWKTEHIVEFLKEKLQQ